MRQDFAVSTNVVLSSISEVGVTEVEAELPYFLCDGAMFLAFAIPFIS